jgi:hypothetical protein
VASSDSGQGDQGRWLVNDQAPDNAARTWLYEVVDAQPGTVYATNPGWEPVAAYAIKSSGGMLVNRHWVLLRAIEQPAAAE